MEISFEDILKVFLAIVVGSVIGVEREFRSKSAGFLTFTIIIIGSTLFTIFSQKIGAYTSPERIASNIVVGIGFIGAGIIFQGENHISGLTTAAIMWLAAALGMGIGGGFYSITIFTTIAVVALQFVIKRIEKKIDLLSKKRKYKIVCNSANKSFSSFEELFKKNHLYAQALRRVKHENKLIGIWIVHGKAKDHDKIVETFLKEKEIIELEY